MAAACRSTVQSISASANCGARASTVPSWSTTTEWPSKTSSSWPPTRLQNATADEVVARALDEHRLALDALAGEVGRGGRVDDQRRPGQRLLGRRAARASRCPRRSLRPMRAVAEVDDHRLVAGLEVALLVEDAVVGQPQLAVDAVDSRRRRARRARCRRRRRARGSRRAPRSPPPPRATSASACWRAGGSAPSAAGPRAGSRSARARGRARARRPASRARGDLRPGPCGRCRRGRRRGGRPGRARASTGQHGGRLCQARCGAGVGAGSRTDQVADQEDALSRAANGFVGALTTDDAFEAQGGKTAARPGGHRPHEQRRGLPDHRARGPAGVLGRLRGRPRGLMPPP